MKYECDVTIHVSDSAVMQLVLAGMECYAGDPSEQTETGGLLWGYKAENRNDMDHYMVEHVCTDIHATRDWNSVTLDPHNTDVKERVVAERWPHLTMIGDFHTHPYTNYTEAKDNHGWQASPGDIRWYESKKPAQWQGRIFLILTIAKLDRVHEGGIKPEVITKHTLYWQQLGQYRLWLSAYKVDELDGRLVVSPKPKAKSPRRYVYVDAPTINGTNVWFSYE